MVRTPRERKEYGMVRRERRQHSRVYPNRHCHVGACGSMAVVYTIEGGRNKWQAGVKVESEGPLSWPQEGPCAVCVQGNVRKTPNPIYAAQVTPAS